MHRWGQGWRQNYIYEPPNGGSLIAKSVAPLQFRGAKTTQSVPRTTWVAAGHIPPGIGASPLSCMWLGGGCYWSRLLSTRFCLVGVEVAALPLPICALLTLGQQCVLCTVAFYGC